MQSLGRGNEHAARHLHLEPHGHAQQLPLPREGADMSRLPAYPSQGLKMGVFTLLCYAGPEQSARLPRCGVH